MTNNKIKNLTIKFKIRIKYFFLYIRCDYTAGNNKILKINN